MHVGECTRNALFFSYIYARINTFGRRKRSLGNTSDFEGYYFEGV